MAEAKRQKTAADDGLTIPIDRDRAIGFLRDMVRVGKDGENAVQALVSKRLAASGCSVAHIHYSPEGLSVKGEFASDNSIDAGKREVVIGKLPAAGGGRSLILFAHPDTETVRGTEEWTHKPFEAEVDSSRLYGWGVADDLMGVAAGVCAMEAISNANIQLGGECIMSSTPSKRHARGFTAVINNGFAEADAAVYLHPAESGAGLKEIKALASGQLIFHIKVKGKCPETTEPGHAAFAHLAVNPLDKAIVLQQALTKLGEERAKRIKHPTLEAACGRSTNVLVSSMKCGFDRSFTRVSPVCEMGAAVTYPPDQGEGPNEVRAEIEAAIRAAAEGDEWMREPANAPEVTWLSGCTGSEVKTSEPIYQTVSGAITHVTGTTPFVNAMHTESDIRVPLVQKGIPCVGIGSRAGDLTQDGLVDEWVDLDDFVRFVEVATRIILSWCGRA